MSIEDRQRWDERHRKAAGLNPRPSVLALPAAGHAGALALDLACGQGRHSLALVRAGYRVVALDVSMQALARLRSLPPARDGSLLPVHADVEAWPLASAVLDLLVQVDFLDRRLFATMRNSLRPGGMLLVDTFLDQGRRNAEGPSSPDFLLAAGELPRAFGDFELIRYEEQRGETARATLLARKR